MRVRAGVGWQYALADLSLILFMVCAAALSREQKAHAGWRPPAGTAQSAAPPRPPGPALPGPALPGQAGSVQAVALAEPVAIWRAGPGMPTLEQWLASQAIDPRQRLTIVAQYANGRARMAFARAQDALQDQPRLPPSTRIVVEPATADGLSATLTWDLGGQ